MGIGSPAIRCRPSVVSTSSASKILALDLVAAPQLRPQLHRGAQQVQEAGCMNGLCRRALGIGALEAVGEGSLALGDREPAQVVRPSLDHRVRLEDPPGTRSRSASTENPTTGPRSSRTTRNAQSARLPPQLDEREGLVRALPPRQLQDRRQIVAPGRVDGEVLVRRGEVGLADRRVLEQVDEVGGIAPHVLARARGRSRPGGAATRRRDSVGTGPGPRHGGRPRRPRESCHGGPGHRCRARRTGAGAAGRTRPGGRHRAASPRAGTSSGVARPRPRRVPRA